MRNTLRAAARRLLSRSGKAPNDRDLFLAPPSCPDGMVVGPPSFVGLGVQKAGTSRWMALLNQHPQIHVPDFGSGRYPESFPKERHFFDNFFKYEFEARHVDVYHKWFPRPPGTITGEWTPRYLVDMWTAPLLARAAPEAKLLILLRDPVTRYTSGMAQRQRNHRLMADDAVAHYSRGLYAAQLRHWFEHFPRSRFLVLQFEKCVEEPESQLARTFEFLEIDDVHIPRSVIDKKRNARRSWTDYTLPAALKEVLVGRYAHDVRELKAIYPELDLSIWPNFAHLA